ncbi:MAG: alkaline phosphatase D family protein [Holophagales bacterium]|nr:alkaline phosphatase D family protein [Holophagales bacterium]
MKRSRSRCSALLTTLLVASAGAASARSGEAAPAPSEDFFPQGVASGEVAATSAVLWTRAREPAQLRLEAWPLTTDGEPRAPESPVWSSETEAKPETDLTAQVRIEGLEADTEYLYRWRRLVGDGADPSAPRVDGRFRTAPARDDDTLVSFVVGGDLGGQAYCRQPDRGYDIFASMGALGPDFFIANGDMIYADNPCPAVGPLLPGGGRWRNIPGDFRTNLEVDWTDRDALVRVYAGHWAYNRADPHHRAFLERVPYYAQWDDHEVINDFGASWPAYPPEPGRTGYGQLVELGKRALLLWNPIGDPAEEIDERKIYRSFRWGRHLELFLLDGRSYRSVNELADTPYHAKVLLGDIQRRWLVEGLKSSDATWKIVSSNVPLSIPTGWPAGLYGRDGFANGTDADSSKRTGFERELLALLAELDRENVRNLVLVVTDVHLAAHLRYETDFDGDGDLLRFHELVNGPLNALDLPTLPKLDPTLRPVILFSEGDLFNFSYLRLVRGGEGDREVHLVADIRDREGEAREGSRLVLRPEPEAAAEP